jgi:hypothetical protein
MVEEIHAVEEKALAELRSEQFEGAEDKDLVLSFDLDGDGRSDSLVGKLWSRWGRMHWEVRFADGRVSDGGPGACKRVGVLSQKTLGYHDLVCDLDTFIRWDGNSYALENEASP